MPSRCIQLGKADRMFAGGGEELDWTLSVLFDAMGAMSSKFNDTPERASRAYDKDRDGFVISGGGGILVLEDLEVAKARGAKIYAEVDGLRRHVRRRRHGGAVRRRRGALHEARRRRLPGRGAAQRCRSNYINTHGTSTPVGRHHRARCHPRRLRQQQAAGRQLDQVADRAQPRRDRRARGGLLAADVEGRFRRGLGQHRECRSGRRSDYPVARLKRIDNAGLQTVMSNSFGFGGTNACLLFSRYDSLKSCGAIETLGNNLSFSLNIHLN